MQPLTDTPAPEINENPVADTPNPARYSHLISQTPISGVRCRPPDWTLQNCKEASVNDHKFVIEPHFRLQEWVAEEKRYFADEGLDYIFRETIRSSDGKAHDVNGAKSGAFQTFEQGRKSDVNCACHWTVNVAAAKGHGKLWADVYS